MNLVHFSNFITNNIYHCSTEAVFGCSLLSGGSYFGCLTFRDGTICLVFPTKMEDGQLKLVMSSP